jgi:hypothetical protein
MTTDTRFWPDGARLAVTVSMQFEAGGQPISGAPGPVDEPIEPGYPDQPQNSFYEDEREPAEIGGLPGNSSTPIGTT